MITLYDLAYQLFPELLPFKTKILYNFYNYKASKKADIFFVISKHTIQDYIKKYRISEEKIILHYLDCNSTFKDYYKNKKYQSYIHPEKYLLVVGNLEPRKNIKLAVKSFLILKKNNKYSDIKLVLIGAKRWLFNSVFPQNDIDHIKNDIIITGYLEEAEIAEYYRNAIALLYPSLYEGFGLPILEAQNCGCPVITSDISAIPEVGGDSVIYINPYELSGEEFHREIVKMIEDKKFRKSIIEKGYSNIKRFSWIKEGESIIKIFEKKYAEKKRVDSL